MKNAKQSQFGLPNYEKTKRTQNRSATAQAVRFSALPTGLYDYRNPIRLTRAVRLLYNTICQNKANLQLPL